VLGNWANIGRTQPEYEAVQFKQAFRMSKPAFKTLCETHCATLASVTHKCGMQSLLRRGRKCFWIRPVQVLTIRCLRGLTILVRVQCVMPFIEVVYVLCKEFVPSMMVFPDRHELMHIMRDFRGLCNLPFVLVQ